MRKGQLKMDEFVFVLLAGIILIGMFMLLWVPAAENIPVVEPTSISLAMERGATRTFNIIVSGNVTNVTLSVVGEVTGWITFNKNNFDAISTPVTVGVKVTVPKIASVRTYSGSIVASSAGGEKRVPVTIEVVSVAPVVLSLRVIPLGDFSISFVAGGKSLDSKENIEVSKGYFSENSVNLIGVLTDSELSTVTSGYVRLIIENTNNLGNLIITLNDQEIYNGKAPLGELNIPVDKSMIKKSNAASIKADTPGWMFWDSTVYKIRTAEIAVNFEGTFSKDVQFSLEKDEIDKFDHFQFSARVKSHSTPMPELLIKVNDQIVFLEKPPISFINTTFSKDILGNSLLLTPTNTITFSIESKGYYDIANAVLTVFRRE